MPQANEQGASASARLDPNPAETNAKTPKSEDQFKVSKAKTVQQEKAKDDKDKTKAKVQPCLDLGNGYSLSHKPESGYSITARVLARLGRFKEVARLLGQGVDLKDKRKINKLVKLMFVKKADLERSIREDEGWKQHVARKTKRLRERATNGDQAAQKIIDNPTRFNQNGWIGRVDEIITTCCGSYNHLVKGGSRTPNRNVKKFKQAGVVMRAWPICKPAGFTPLQEEYSNSVMLIPEQHAKLVSKIIIARLGWDEVKTTN